MIPVSAKVHPYTDERNSPGRFHQYPRGASVWSSLIGFRFVHARLTYPALIRTAIPSPCASPLCMMQTYTSGDILQRSTAPDSTPGREEPGGGSSARRGAAAGATQGTSTGSGGVTLTSSAPSRGPKELTQRQRQLLAKMRANRSSNGE